jgi:hypothetical protein
VQTGVSPRFQSDFEGLRWTPETGQVAKRDSRP